MKGFNERLRKLESQPVAVPWKFNVRDLELAWGPLGDGEREFLEGLSLEEAQNLIEKLYADPDP